MTPLHLAVGYALTSGDNSVVKTLYEYKADFSAEDDVCYLFNLFKHDVSFIT